MDISLLYDGWYLSIMCVNGFPPCGIFLNKASHDYFYVVPYIVCFLNLVNTSTTLYYNGLQLMFQVCQTFDHSFYVVKYIVCKCHMIINKTSFQTLKD